MKKHFLQKLTVFLSFLALISWGQTAWGQTTIFTESMGSVSTTTTISAHETANGFDNDAYTMTQGGATNPADVRNTNPSSGYIGASGLANIWFTTTNNVYGFAIEGIDVSAYSSLNLSYGYYKNSSTAHATFSVDYWNGSSWITIANTSANLFNEASNASTGWYLAKSLNLPVEAQINGLKIRFVKSGSNGIRIDDIKLVGTLPTCTAPTTQASNLTFSPVGATSMTLNWERGTTPGDGVIIVAKEGSTPDNPTNNTAYTANAAFGSGTEIGTGTFVVYSGSGTTVNITGLNSESTYYFKVFEKNCSGTSIMINTTAPATGNQLTNSNNSDIIENISFSYPANIAYAAYQATDILNDATSIEVAQFTIRDGGTSSDIDNRSTQLSAITFSIANHENIRRIALYDGSTELGEAAAASTVTFNGLSLIATDGNTKNFSIRVSFNTLVTDNQQIRFTVTSAQAESSGSEFAETNAGGASSSISGDINRLEVTATKLAFTSQPSNTVVNIVMSPSPAVKAYDENNNTDLDYNSAVSVLSSGDLTGEPVTGTWADNVNTFANLVHTNTGTGLMLTASSGSLTDAVSSPFNITEVLIPSIVVSDNGTQVAAGNVYLGTSNHILSSFKVEVSTADATLTDAAIYLEGTFVASDISSNGLKLWYNTSNNFTSATELNAITSLGSGGLGEIITFTGFSQNITASATGYFWITANISASASVNNTIQVLSVNNTDLVFTSGSKSGAASEAGVQTILLLSYCASDLIISEYVVGSGNNKYIEIYNGTNSTINLADYRLRLYNNGATSPNQDILLSGTLASEAVIVYKHTSATLYEPATTNAACDFNGDDAIALYKISTSSNVDIFGRIGEDPGTAWTGGGLTTLDRTLVRKSTITSGVTVNPTSGFPTLSTEWIQYNQDVISNLGTHTMSCTPILTVSPTTLSNFNYVYGTGASASKTYVLSGTGLTGFPADITVTGSTNYEVSINNTDFYASINVPYTSSTLTGTTIYVRLKSDLDVGNYNSETISNAVSGATTKYVTCNGFVSVSAVSTLSASASLLEPATISSVWDTYAESFATFDFNFVDDNGSGGDNQETKISQIVIHQGTGNEVADWTKVIAYARLVDNNGKELVGYVNAEDIIFSNIPFASATNDLGYVADNATKTYTLYVYFLTDLGTEKATIDGKNLVFEVNNSGFNFDVGSSILASSQAINSGSSNNEIVVTASKLLFTTNKPPTTTILNTNTNVEVEATDENGNRDLNNAASVTLSKHSGTGNISSATGLAQNLSSGLYSWTDVQFDTPGNFTISVDDGGSLVDAISDNILVTIPPTVIWSDNCDPQHTWDLDNGTANWVNISPTANPSEYSGNCFKTAAGNTHYANSKEYILTSEVINLSGYSSCAMSFWLWMAAEPTWDGGIIEFSTNGTNWTKFTGDLAYDGNITALGTTCWYATRTTWTKVNVDISSLDDQSSIQFRFRFKTDGSTTNYGWAVDEMQITGIPSCLGPSIQASDLIISNIQTTSIDLNYTRGNGDAGVIIVARQDSPVDTDPINGTDYNAGFFGLGSEIGSGNWVVYKGTESSCTINGLDENTTYHFAVYEYNASGYCYNKTELTGNARTICSVPTNVTNVSAEPASTIVYLNWTNSTCYDEIMIVAKPLTTIAETPTGNGSTYTADLNFSGGGTIFDGTGKVVYKGADSPQVVYGLTNNTLYYFRIFTRVGESWSNGVEVSTTPVLGTLAANGSGTATAVNGLTGEINGMTFWRRNQTTQIIELNVTGVSSGWLQNVQINLSSAFTGLSAPNVTISGSAVYGGTTITNQGGQVLLINNLNLTNTKTLNIRIIGLNTNDITLDTDLGNKTINVLTGNTAGSRSEIATSPEINLTIPFANAKRYTDNGSTAVLINKGETVVVEGVSTIASNRLATSSYDQFFIQEGDGANARGLCIRKGSIFDPAAIIAHLYVVKGPLDLVSGSATGLSDVYANMTAINTPTEIVDLGPATLPTPYFTTIEELYAMSYTEFEEVDGLLMRIPAIAKKSGTWPDANESGSVQMVDYGYSNDIRCYIFAKTDVGGTEPVWPKNMSTLVYNYNNTGNYMWRQITPVYKTMFFENITWNGSTGNGLWNDALNWSPNILPQNTDDVVFDNITGPANSYTVTYNVTSAQNINSLRINPNVGNNITLNFPNTCNFSPALTLNKSGDALIIENGGVVNANFGTASGYPLTFAASGTTGRLRINNGGKFVWRADESNSYLVDRLSTEVGTENGTFEFDIISGGAELISVSNRTYGNLVLSATNGSKTYNFIGANPLTVRGSFILNSGVSLNETFSTSYSATIFVGGDFVFDGDAWQANTTTNLPTNLIVMNGTNHQTISGTGFAGGFNKNIQISNNNGVTINSNLELNGELTIDNASNLTIAYNAFVSTNNTINNNAGASGLILKSTNLGTASLKLVTPNIEATVERYINGTHWYYMFPTLTEIQKILYTKEGSDNNSNFYSYLEDNEDYWTATTVSGTSGWTSEVSGTATIRTDKGYIYNRYHYPSKTMVQVGGTLHVGDKTFPVTKTTTHTNPFPPTGYVQDWNYFDGWNLVGNPYTCAINWDLVDKTNIESAVYVYDDAIDKYRYYISNDDTPEYSTQLGGLIDETEGQNMIPAGQGFMVKAISNGNFVLQNDDREHSSQPYWKNKIKVTDNILKLSVNQNSYFDELIVRTLPSETGVTNNHDVKFDAYKMFAWDKTRPQIYTTNENYSTILAINTIPEIAGSEQIPVGLFVGCSGIHSIKTTQNTFVNTHVVLEDKLDNKMKNLMVENEYSFTSSTGTHNSRFVLHFNPNTYPIIEGDLENIAVLEDEPFSFNQQLVINDSDFGDILNVTASLDNGNSLPSWINFNPETINFEGVAGNEHVGIYNIKINVTDIFNARTSVTFQLEVINTNNAPVVNGSIDNQTVSENAQFLLTVPEDLIIDNDPGDVLTYSARLTNGNGLPNWLSFDGNTRTFEGVPSNDYVGTYTIRYTATDLSGAYASVVFNITVLNVNDAPYLANPIDDIQLNINDQFVLQIPENTFVDIDLFDVLTYSANLENGANLPLWLSFDAASRTFSGTPTQAQQINIELTVTDQSNESASDVFELTVVNPNSIINFGKFDVLVFPNPAKDRISIKKQGTNEKLEITIRTITGVCVLKQTMDSDIKTISLNKFASGIYYLEVSNKEYLHKVLIIVE